ncbi:winged helix-turn-helix domain-containing protein [Caulobacter sp. KR2-114]|uniref:winged helix-turn-helix domain-containing protein n=1 Tax=Caulobacter sp. KR2-114 TaxID=3400912 RepID=UPI003C06DF53
MGADANQRPFTFGDWEVHPSRGLLTGCEGESVRLEPRLMDLLLLFAGSGGRVLAKDEIAAATWGDRAIGDDTLAAALSGLRRALRATPEQRYIETIAKRGYRAVAGQASLEPALPSAAEGPAQAAALVARGRQALASPTLASLVQARLCFEAAMEKAPGWSPAHQLNCSCPSPSDIPTSLACTWRLRRSPASHVALWRRSAEPVSSENYSYDMVL